MNKQVNAIISLKDKFSGPLLKMSDNVKKLDKQTYDSMRSVNKWGRTVEKNIDKAIKSAVKWTKRGALLLGGVSLKKGYDGIKELDYASRKVKSIAGDGFDLSYIRKELLGLSGDLGKSVEELGNSWYNAISASVPLEDSLMAVEKAHKLSVAGFTTDASAMNLLASTMNTFEMSGEKAMDKISDIFLLTQNRGMILVDEMADLFGQISPVSKALAVSIEDQAASIALFTQKGLKPAKAVTAYGRMLDRFMTKTGKDGLATLKEIGLQADFFSAKTLKDKGFGKAMQELTEATKGDMDKIAKLFPNINAKLAQSIFGGEGFNKFQEIYEQMLDPQGALDKAYEAMEASIPRRMEKLKKRLESINTKFYERYTGQVSDFLEQAWVWLGENEDKVLEFFNSVDRGARKLLDLLKEFGIFLYDNKSALKFLGQVVFYIYAITKATRGLGKVAEWIKDVSIVLKELKSGTLVTAFGSPGKLLLISGAIFLVVSAIKYMIKNWDKIEERYPKIATLIKNIGKLFQWLATHIGDAITLIIDTIQFLWDVLRPIVDGIFNFILGIVEGFLSILIGIFKTIWGVLKIGLGLFTANGELVKEGLGLISDGIIDIWNGLVEIVTAPITAVVNSVIDNFLQGESKVREKWLKLKEFLDAPISGTVNMTSNLQKQDYQTLNRKDPRNRGVGRNYKGTPNWKGGLTEIHERGGEVVDLPSGTRIYPHDRSVEMAYNQGSVDSGTTKATSQSVVLNLGGINFHGDINGQTDINKIGTQIVTVIKDQLGNI